MKIGVIGVESGHVELFRAGLASLFPTGDTAIVLAWRADAPYEKCALETTEDPWELIGRSDAVIVSLRYGMHHTSHALACLTAGKPVFVDKPFALLSEDAARMEEAARERGVPLTGGSTLCFLPQIEELKGTALGCLRGGVSYWSDPFSPYGGWPFYGSHSADLCAAVFGVDALWVEAEQTGGRLEARIGYPKRTVALTTDAHPAPPVVTVDGTAYPLNEQEGFFYAMRRFVSLAEAYRKGSFDRSDDAARLAFSVRLMEAMFASVREGKRVWMRGPTAGR